MPNTSVVHKQSKLGEYLRSNGISSVQVSNSTKVNTEVVVKYLEGRQYIPYSFLVLLSKSYPNINQYELAISWIDSNRNYGKIIQ